jgi:hypothetical protein
MRPAGRTPAPTAGGEVTEPFDLVGGVADRYLAANREVSTLAIADVTVHAAWQLTLELAQHVDSVLRGWRVRVPDREFMALSTFEAAFGNEHGRWGAEMTAALSRPIEGAVIEVGDGMAFRVVGGKWERVDTPSETV